MGADYQGSAIRGLKATWWYTRNFAVNSLRRGLILGRYSLACWQKQKVNQAMGHLGAQFFQALERGETNPLVVSEVSDAVQKAKDLKEIKDKNYQAIAAIRDRMRAAWMKEPLPPPPAATEAPPETAEEAEKTEKPQEHTAG
jgi:hypothetical protein